MGLKVHFKHLILLAAFAVSSVHATQQTDALSVAEIQLKNLRTSSLAVSYTANKPTVLMIFQPNCPWCKKQGHILSRLQQECGNKVHFNLVGDNGTRQQLKRELRHFSAKLDSQISTVNFIRQSGGVKGYPTTLVIDSKGHVLAKRRGFTSEKLLRKLTNELSAGVCTI